MIATLFPIPGQSTIDSEENFVAPRTMVEEVLATIWSQVLDREGIGRESNFFWLGGHSLLAMRIIFRIRESFNVEMPVRDLFEAPVLWELAARIEALIRSDRSVEVPSLRPRADNDQLPLSYAQQRLWFLDQLMPGSKAYNIPAEMYISADLDVAALEQSLSEVLRRHEALRTTFVLASGQPISALTPQ